MCSARSTWSWLPGRIGREGCGYATITGQGNGQGGREHGQKCDQLPGVRDISNPEHRAYIAGVWGVDEKTIPAAGVDAYEIFAKWTAAKSRDCFRFVSIRLFHCRTTISFGSMLEKLEFYVAIDFFLNETARYADVVLPGSLHEEDEGIVTTAEGRVIKINKAIDCPGEAREDWKIIQDIARALGREHGFHV